MATTNKVLAQSKPSAATLTDAYTCAASSGAIVTGITACNQSSTATSIRVSIAVAGAGNTAAQYVAYGLPIGGNETIFVLDGVLTIANTDVVRVYNTDATVSFNVFGQEVT